MSGVLYESNLHWHMGSLLNSGLIQVGSGFSKIKLRSSPTEPSISPYMHMLITILLCVFMRGELKFSHSKMGVRVKSRGRKKRKEQDRLVEAKETPPLSKNAQVQTPPNTKKIIRIKLNFTVGFPRRDNSSFPLKNHILSAQFVCVSN